MAEDNTRTPAPTSARAEIDAFLEKARSIASQRQASTGRGRLLFALDATMSRQPTWDMACAIQADMFREAASAGGLDVQLIYYRGFGECRATQWVSDTMTLGGLMAKIDCRSGHTQIRKILSHALRENSAQKLGAVVFVGDAMEESADDLRRGAGELGMYGVPVFVFQEGDDPAAAVVFRDIARLSKGAYCRFSAGSAQELAELLRAVAAYASGGLQALQLAQTGSGAARLLAQMR